MDTDPDNRGTKTTTKAGVYDRPASAGLTADRKRILMIIIIAALIALGLWLLV